MATLPMGSVRLGSSAVTGSGSIKCFSGSFKVTAPLGHGEQVLVCGDAPSLGRWSPHRA
ncbi:unnamed protein product, partial [Discosporangium mesarthrocarpum]